MLELKCHKCGVVVENKYDENGNFITTNIGQVIHPYLDEEGYYFIVKGERLSVEPFVACNKCHLVDRRQHKNSSYLKLEDIK